jgi:hypothetical protein
VLGNARGGGATLRQRPDQGTVDQGAALRRHRRLQRLRHQVVLEPEQAACGVAAAHQARRQRRLERAQRFPFAECRRAGGQGQVEVVADQAGRFEQALRRLTEHANTGGERGMHRRRNRQLAVVLGGIVERRRPAPAGVDAEHPGLDQVGQGLEGEQRVAAGGAPEPAREALATLAAGQRAHQLEHRRLVEWLERDRRRSGCAEDGGQRVGDVAFCRPGRKPMTTGPGS